MLAIVSPAKKMNFDEIKRPLVYTDPDFFSDTKKLVKSVRKLSHFDIQKLMNLSEPLTELNFNGLKPSNQNSHK